MLSRTQSLFVVLTGIFITNALIAEFVGVKIFAMEDTLGLNPLNWQLFGQQGSLNFTAGVMLWPVVFILTDVINEYFGERGVRFISWLAVGLILYGFVFAYLAISLAPATWWVTVSAGQGVPDMQKAFAAIFGQGMWSIGGSVTAFLVAQLIDVRIFHAIRRRTGDSKVWLRATGSTLVSQFVDSFVVLYIAFVLGPQQWSMGLFLAIGTVNYCYKALMAIALTPVIYGVRRGIKEYLGEEEAGRLKQRAQLDG
ncbi:MAG: queuosine precursor transporter [Rhodanobacteraceae bacterium]|nr:queuosine precursor transporter [Rhodanobacteraceae bacterium]